MSHHLKMLLGCLLPLLLIALLPVFDVSDTVAVFIFIVLMFVCHLGMMRGHHKHGSHHHKYSSNKGEHRNEQA